MSAPTPARRAAYEVLRRVFEHGAWADRALRSAAERHGLEGRERAQAQRLAYGAVQRRGTTDHIAGKLARRPVSKIDPPLLAALRLGLFELLFNEGGADHAAVDQSVELAKGGAKGGGRGGGSGAGPRGRGSGLVNALLRRAADEREQILARLGEGTPKAAAAAHSLPRWIAELWWRELGEETALAVMRSINESPARCFRPAVAGTGEAIASTLTEAGGEVFPAAITGWPGELAGLFELRSGGWPQAEALVSAGELFAQAAGSALVGAICAPEPGERVLDLCAAPGIKSSQLAAAVGPEGELVAVESDPGRASELGRLTGQMPWIRVIEADGRSGTPGSGYDRVVVDAPCSGLGTVASRPDSRWRRERGDIAELSALQGELIAAGADAVRPGGRLVYSVCTISVAEGRDVVSGLLETRPELTPLDLGADSPALADPAMPTALQLLPGRDGTDGFFIAAFERAA